MLWVNEISQKHFSLLGLVFRYSYKSRGLGDRQIFRGALECSKVMCLPACLRERAQRKTTRGEGITPQCAVLKRSNLLCGFHQW